MKKGMDQFPAIWRSSEILSGRLLFVLVTLLTAAGCNQANEEYYTMEDYARVKKIDTHIHLSSSDSSLGALARQDNFFLLSVNVDVPDNPPLDDQEKYALQQIGYYPDRVAYLTAFDLKHWNDPDWTAQTIARLKNSFSHGALGIKIWKNIGMTYRDSTGKFIMVDNPRFDSVINYVIGQDKTVMGHLGEPKNCWLPLDSMTVNNDRSYFKEHPEYHMYLHPEYPSYEEQINARDRFLERHPDIRFVGAHLGSLEWSVDELAKRLDKFSGMAVDVAARMPHLQYQSIHDYKKVRDFLIKYQDRLVYGSDSGIEPGQDGVAAANGLHRHWQADWQYFVTTDTLHSDMVNGAFTGMHLPKQVVNKIYHDNAVKWFRIKN